MESSWTMITRRSCQSTGNTARGILFMKERFTSIPLESLCSRCAFANWCYFAASGRLSGFRHSVVLNKAQGRLWHSDAVKVDKLTRTMSWCVSLSGIQTGWHNKHFFWNYNANMDSPTNSHSAPQNIWTQSPSEMPHPTFLEPSLMFHHSVKWCRQLFL